MKDVTEHKWKTGYCAANVEDMNPLHFKWLRKNAVNCERFILGIPNKEIMIKLYGDKDSYDAELVKEFWCDIKWVDEVVLDKVQKLILKCCAP